MRKFLTLLCAAFISINALSFIPCEATNRNQYTPNACCEICGKPDCRGCDVSDLQYQICTPLFKVLRQAPESGVVDEELAIDIEVYAQQDVSDVVIRETVSGHAKIIRTSPEAQINHGENEVVWTFDCMNRGECKKLRLWVMTENVGDICDCVTVDALPRICATTFIGKCNLSLESGGPECLCLNECGSYVFKIYNTGTACARDVVVTTIVPPGMCHESGKSELSWRLGDMAENCGDDIRFVLQVMEAGNHCIVAKAVAANNCEISESVCTLVQQPNIAISCSATEKAFVGKEAKASITVTNTGDMEQCEVVVTDDISPCDIDIFDASGGHVRGSCITWELGSMAAGASKTLGVTFCSPCPGDVYHRINVTGCNDCCRSEASCECVTRYIGHPGLLIEMIDTCDPMLVGEQTTYRIRVTNQGTAPDTDVTITAAFPPELEPIAASGSTDGQISGQGVSFGAYPQLDPGQSIQYSIDAKAKAKGDGRVKVQLRSALLKNPVTEEESTYIY